MNMKTKIIIILIVLVGLGVGGFFVWKNSSAPDKIVDALDVGDEVRKERIKENIQEKLEEEKTLQSSKSSRAVCIETGGGVPSEMCEKIPLQGFESFKSYKTWCLEIGGVPEMCTSFEPSCKEFGLTTVDECFRILSNPETWNFN